jgi:hypothetical protein
VNGGGGVHRLGDFVVIPKMMPAMFVGMVGETGVVVVVGSLECERRVHAIKGVFGV